MQMGCGLERKMDQSVFRVPGPWESKSSDKDIEDIKPVQTRGKVRSYVTNLIYLMTFSRMRLIQIHLSSRQRTVV